VDDLNGQIIVDIEWAPEDALPFMLCISSLGEPPGCELLESVSVARGNVVLVDYGRTLDPEPFTVPEGELVPTGCKGIGEPNETVLKVPPFRPTLEFFPVTHAVPFPEPSVVSQVQARILTGMMDRVLLMVGELWKKSKAGICLSTQEIAEVGLIFGAKALGDVKLVYTKPVKGRDSLCKKQAIALKKLIALENVYLAKKHRRVETLAKRARSGYLMGISETKEIEAMFGESYALDLEKSSNYISASLSINQDPRLANPCISFNETKSGAIWSPRRDLLDSGPLDRHFVAEIENDGHAILRFGDGDLGEVPEPGIELKAVYRAGNGLAGNVGREAISYLVFHIPGQDGIARVRNPLPARGGTDPELLADVRLFAPGAFRKDLQRAITTEDYALLVERDFEDRVQRAAAEMRWNGSWYEVQVAVDPRQTTEVNEVLLDEVLGRLQRYRRIGHNLTVRPAEYVPLDIEMIICVLPNHHRGQVKADLLDIFSNRVLPDGKLGLFHPDNLTFGWGIRLSNLVAAAGAVTGVENVVVTKLERLFEGPRHEIENGILPIGSMEVARLDNDPSFPENGRLSLLMRGGI
jgi:predicted phage baseplate assembly protein